MNEDASRGARTTVVGLAIGLAAFLAAALPVLGNGFVWDDVYLVSVFKGLGDRGQLALTFTKPFWENSGTYALSNDVYWRPLTSFCMWLTGAAFGRSPVAFHALSLIALCCASLALYTLARRLLPNPSLGPAAAWIALAFAAHPLGAEVLCLVGNTSDHLAFAFLALETAVFFDALRGRRSLRFALPAGAVLGFLACSSKELGVVSALAPLAALLLSSAVEAPCPPRGRLMPWLLTAAVVPVAAFLGLRALVLGAVAAVHVDPKMPLLVFVAFGQSILRAFAPLGPGLVISIDEGEPLSLVMGAVGAGLLSIAAWRAIHVRRRPSLALIGLLVALALLVPSLLAAKTGDGTLEIPTRYLHLPLAGLLLAALPAVASRMRLLKLLGPLVVILFATISFVRVREWRNDLVFWAAEAEHDPQSPMAGINLALALLDRRAFDAAGYVLDRTEAMHGLSRAHLSCVYSVRAGIARERDHDLERTSALLRTALTLMPWNYDAVVVLAETRSMAGRPDHAATILEKALGAPWFDNRQKQALGVLLDRYRAASRKNGNSVPIPHPIE
jgi:hypothetical protein